MRKLASIQKIESITPIEGADAIERAQILGWEVVVKKGEFQSGDICVYVEIDSILPDRPEFEFMKARNMRVRTIRLRGQVSQGICFPLSILGSGKLHEDMDASDTSWENVIDMDVTEELEIIKWEPMLPACLGGKAKGNFPSFIPKTDETRVQNSLRELQKYEGKRCYITEKLDGSSCTVFINNGEFGVCSRNLNLIESEENSFWKAVRELDLVSKLKSWSNIALQGELIGEGIQGNKYGLKGVSLRFFNAFDIDKQRYYEYEEMMGIFTLLQVPTVPILADEYFLTTDIKAMVQSSIVKSHMLTPKPIWAEGIVIRTIEANPQGHIFSVKAINPEFLLKHGE